MYNEGQVYGPTAGNVSDSSALNLNSSALVLKRFFKFTQDGAKCYLWRLWDASDSVSDGKLTGSQSRKKNSPDLNWERKVPSWFSLDSFQHLWSGSYDRRLFLPKLWRILSKFYRIISTKTKIIRNTLKFAKIRTRKRPDKILRKNSIHPMYKQCQIVNW